MNDFTKQELECLHNAIDLQLKNIPMSETNALRRTELKDKIQSMIDNYCLNNGHDYEFSLGRGKCENCGDLE